MSIEWQEELATGIAAIDEQHKEIFARFAAFSTACSDGGGKEELAGLVHFLEEYANGHFRDEEKAMLDAEYEGLHVQQQAHRFFTGNVAELKRKVGENAPNMPEILELKRLLIRWLIQHIKQIDMAFADFLKAHPANR
jgi:hemerythrin